MKKTNKTLAVVLATAMFATLGCGCDNSLNVKAEKASKQITQTANDKNSEKGILDGFKTIKTFNFNDKYARFCMNSDKFLIERRKDRNYDGNEKQALYSIDGKRITDYTEDQMRICSNGCVFVRSFLYSKNMKLVSTKVKDVQGLDSNYVLVKMKKKNNYRIYNSKGKVVKKIKKSSDLASALEKYKSPYITEEFANKEDSDEYNMKKYHLVQNETNEAIYDKEGNEIASCIDDIRFYDNCYIADNTKRYKSEFYNANGKMLMSFDLHKADNYGRPYQVFSETDGKHALVGNSLEDKIYIVNLETDQIKEFNTKIDDFYGDNGVIYYDDLNAFGVWKTYYDSGVCDNRFFGFFDLDGNKIFKNKDGIEVRDYLGNGYFFFSKNNKLGLGLLKSFPEVKASKLVKNIRFWKKYPKGSKVKKTKKKGNTLKISLKKVKGADGYIVKVYTSEMNAIGDIKPSVFKSKKPLVKVNLKKFKNKRKLYVRIYTYVKDLDGRKLKTISEDINKSCNSDVWKIKIK